MSCAGCVPDPPRARAELPLKTTAVLIDEPHFIVSIRDCTRCRQRFVSVFCERIDWKEGKDPQVSALMPLTDEEAAAAVNQLDLKAIEQLAYGRKFLRDVFHEDGRTLAYVCGAIVAPHD